MSSSLERKIEAAKRRAEEERKARGGLSTDQFAHGNHDTDGKVHPGISRSQPASPPAAPAQRQWVRSGQGWAESGKPGTVHTTKDGMPPAGDMRNVIETVDKVGGTHVPDTVPGTVQAPEVGLHPKPQRMWLRDGLAWVDDNEDRAAFYFTRNGEQPTEDMANVDSVRHERGMDMEAYGQLQHQLYDYRSPDSSDALLYMMEIMKRTVQDAIGIPPARRNGKNAAAVRRMFPDNEADQALALQDLVMCGAAYMKDGKRVDPRDVHIRERPVLEWWGWDEGTELPSGNFGQRELPEIISNIQGRKRDESANPASGRIKLQQPHPLFKDPDARANITVGPGQQQRYRDLHLVNEEAAAVAASPEQQAKLTMEQLRRMGHVHPEGTILKHKSDPWPSTEHYEF